MLLNLCMCCHKGRLERLRFLGQSASRSYQHVGILVLLSEEGGLVVDPPFITRQFTHGYMCLDLASQLQDHQHRMYGQCLRKWIYHMHEGAEAEYSQDFTSTEYSGTDIFLGAPSW